VILIGWGLKRGGLLNFFYAVLDTKTTIRCPTLINFIILSTIISIFLFYSKTIWQFYDYGWTTPNKQRALFSHSPQIHHCFSQVCTWIWFCSIYIVFIVLYLHCIKPCAFVYSHKRINFIKTWPLFLFKRSKLICRLYVV